MTKSVTYACKVYRRWRPCGVTRHELPNELVRPFGSSIIKRPTDNLPSATFTDFVVRTIVIRSFRCALAPIRRSYAFFFRFCSCPDSMWSRFAAFNAKFNEIVPRVTSCFALPLLPVPPVPNPSLMHSFYAYKFLLRIWSCPHDMLFIP